MRRRSREIDTRAQQLELEHETLTARRSELPAGNRLSASITNFAQRALHGIDTLDFHGRQHQHARITHEQAQPTPVPPTSQGGIVKQ